MIGLPPDQFWGMTPFQFSLCISAHHEKTEAEHNRSAWVMWHGAALARVQKMPPLSNFTTGKKHVKGIDERAIIARMKAYQKRRKEAVENS